MRLGKQVGRGVIALACAAALCGVRLAAAQSDPTPAPPPPPGPVQPESIDPFIDPSAPRPEQSEPREGPRAEGRRNMVWDRVAQERLDADRRRLEADMRRLEAERQRLEAELRRAKEAMRRSDRGASRGQRRGPDNFGALPAPAPAPAPMPMPMPMPGGMPMPPGFPGGPAPMNARPYGPPQGQPQPQPRGSDWEGELMRAHGFGGGARGQGWGNATFLGVSVTPLPDSLRGRLRLPAGIGMVVSSVEPGSPAEQAGIQPSDVLHKIDEQLLVNAEQLAVLVRTMKAGREVRVSLVRGGKPTQVTVRLGQRNLPPLSDPMFRQGQGPRNEMRPPMPGMPGMPPMGGMQPPPGAPAFPGPRGFTPPAGPAPQWAPMPQYAPVPPRPPQPSAAPAPPRAPAPVQAGPALAPPQALPAGDLPEINVQLALPAPAAPAAPPAPAPYPALAPLGLSPFQP